MRERLFLWRDVGHRILAGAQQFELGLVKLQIGFLPVRRLLYRQRPLRRLLLSQAPLSRLRHLLQRVLRQVRH